MSAKKILLVDDDKDFVASTKDVLETDGYEIDFAHDGEAGIEKAKTFRPDLMILDVMMATDTEGFDVSRKIKSVPGLEETPVIMLTGIRKAKNLPFGFEPDDNWLPVKAVLEKPVAPGKLLETVKEALA